MSTKGSLRYAEAKYASVHLYHECLDDKVYMEITLGSHLGTFYLSLIIRMPRQLPLVYSHDT